MVRIMSKDLFGVEIVKDVLLRDKYIEPPFTRLDAVSGSWRRRKQMWKQKGMKSEVGRASELSNLSDFNNNPNYETRKNYTGTSIFDPVLTELIYKWYCPDRGCILDPFAGGSVRGIVSNYLGYKYTGIELRKEQVISNREQALSILPSNNQPAWYIGDSDTVLDSNFGTNEFDIIFSCPPYMNLEVYSTASNDLSNMEDSKFIIKYESIILKACNKLTQSGFAIFVVGDVRDKKTGFYKDLITITKLAFYKAGLKLYNEAILLENGLNTAAMRADRQFTQSKKLVKVHQHVLIFKKVGLKRKGRKGKS